MHISSLIHVPTRLFLPNPDCGVKKNNLFKTAQCSNSILPLSRPDQQKSGQSQLQHNWLDPARAYEQDGFRHHMLQILLNPPCTQNRGSVELWLTFHGGLPRQSSLLSHLMAPPTHPSVECGYSAQAKFQQLPAMNKG